MNSSGIKRGLASSAIAALAVAGLPLLASSATASPVNAGVPAGTAVLVAANNDVLSIKADGTDSTIRLEALAASDVTTVAFEYSINGGGAWTSIGSATADDGAFSYEWAPPASIVGLTNVQVRAVANGTAQAPVTGLTINATGNSVNIAAGSALGVFQSPYSAAQNVAVSGTASDASTVRVFAGQSVTTSPQSFSATVTAPATTATWGGILDIAGYSYGTTDQLLLTTDTGAGTSKDVESYSLYKQVITTVTATADKTNVPSGQTATVTVTVKDQNGNPVAGARVGVVGTTATDFTDAKGQKTFTLAGGSTAAYYADATNQNGFDAAVGDKKSDNVTVNQYVAAPTTLAGASVDGAAFDFDEYAGGDLSVQVKDQNGTNLDTTGQTLSYYWVVTPFSGAAAINVPAKDVNGNPTFDTNAVDTAGKFTVPLPVAPAGTYELYAKLGADGLGNGAIAAAKVLTVKAGNAALTFAPAGKVQGALGSTVSVTGTLALEDGTPLPGRTVSTSYSGATSGIVQANGTTGASRTFTTGTDGTFKVDVKDAATPATAESATLTADSTIVNGVGTDATETVDFTAGLTPAEITVAGGAGTSTAGLGKTYTVTLSYDSDLTTAGVQAQPLANTDVTLTVDHGFFTPNTLTPAATPAAGDDAYNLKNLGTSITVKTDANGSATVTTTIAKDAGFDDDGLVDAKITATAGSVSASDTDTWTSANPLNGGTAAIDLAPAALQDSTVLPDVRSDQDASFDVYVTDQFGNKVPGAPVTVSGTGSLAGFSTSFNTNVTVDDDVVVGSNLLGSGTLKVTWTTRTNKYAGTPLAITTSNPPAPGGETLTDTQDVSFYAYDINTATLTLTDSASGSAPVGQAVTVTAKVVDAKGQPVQGVAVAFLRQGPGGVTDGDPNLTVSTNAKGEAYYNFIGTSKGTASVSAVFSDNTGRKTLTDAIAITSTATPTAIKVTLTGDSNGAKDDRLVVTTTGKAAGADITIYKVKKNGKRGGVVATATVNNSGTTKVTVPDTNGKKSTKYVAVVSATDATKAGTSNKKTVK